MVTISKYYSSVTKTGVRPSNPGNVVTVIPEVLNPPDSPVNHSPVTIGSPANGLSLVGQELSLGLASSGVTGALSGTDWGTFNGKLNLTSPITGYVIGANTALAATDTILGAFGKIQGQIGARVSGTIASGQVAFGTGVNTVGGDADFIWDSTNNRLGIGATPLSTFYISRVSGSSSIADPVNNAISVRRSDSPVVFGMGWLSTNVFYLQGKHATNLVSSFPISLNPSGGFVGVGTSSPSAIFHVLNISPSLFETSSSINSIIEFKTTSGSVFIGQRANGEFGIGSTSNLNLGVFSVVPSTSRVGIATTAPSNTLDVNGTTRIRTISNAVGNFLTTSATGVVQQRTAEEVATDIGALNSNQTVVNTAGRLDNLATPTNILIITTSTDITGFVPTVSKYLRVVIKNGSSCLIRNNSSFSLSANRIIGLTTNIKILTNNYIDLFYDTTSSNWIPVGYRIIKANGATGGSSANTFRGSSSLSTISIFEVENSGGSNVFELRGNGDFYVKGDLYINESENFILGTTTGTKIGTATTQKLSFWDATPIVQPTTAVTASTLVSNAGTTLTSTDTFDGYNLAQIVKALRNTGLLA
jgi:hypothetical protein